MVHGLADRPVCRDAAPVRERSRIPLMKTLRLVSTPTRNRRLNEIIGLTVLVGAGLLLLALATYTPSDPSFNTVGVYATGRPAHNWAGMVGAYLADALLQMLGVAAFFLPLVLGRLGLCWMWSRPAGSPLAKSIGLGLWVIFGPAAIALLPGHILWCHALPIEGVTGRLLSDVMVQYLNLPGTCIVVALMVALSLYLTTTFTFNTAREWGLVHFSFAQSLLDRWARWRGTRKSASIAAAKEAYGSKREQADLKAQRARELAERKNNRAENNTLLGGFFSWWSRKKRTEAISITPHEEAAAEPASMWQNMPRTFVDAPPVTPFGTAAAAAAPFADALAKAAAPGHALDDHTNFDDRGFDPEPQRIPAPVRAAKRTDDSRTAPFAAIPAAPQASTEEDISFGKRADADIRPVTIVPKSVRGYKLPPSSLLHHSEEQAHRARRRPARRGPRPGRKMRRVRRRRPGHADQSRARGNDLRVPARGRRKSTPASPGWPTTSASRWPPRSILIERMAGKAPSAYRCQTTSAKPSGCAMSSSARASRRASHARHRPG